ncbi:hypothetical protein ABK040_010901 [Willaertia magna]
MKAVNNKSNPQEQFSLQLFHYLNQQQKDSNVAISPCSLHYCLFMALLGANGNTLSEMQKALCFSNEETKEKMTEMMKEKYEKLLEEEYVLKIVNSVFMDSHFKIVDNYNNLLQEVFKTKVHLCDFEKNFEKERVNINNEVKKQTNNLIKEIIPQNGVNDETKLVLVNAVHFLSDWKEKFDESNTVPYTFNTLQENRRVNFMTKTSVKNQQYGENDKYHWLDMLYKDGNFTMTFIVPKEDEDLNEESENEFNNWLSQIKLGGLQTNKKAIAEIKIPKLDLEFSQEMSNVFKQQPFEMKECFSDNANFSAMDKEDNVKISKVFHKVFVKINEKGTEAAATTAVVMTKRKRSTTKDDVIKFIVDRPFAFVIRHNATNSILFMGRVNDIVQ